MANFWPDLESDLIIFIGALIYVGLIIIIPKALKSKGIISGFVARKIIHSFAGLAVLIAPFMHFPFLAVVLAIVFTIITKRSTDKSRVKMLKELYDAISEDAEKEVGYLQGPFAYCLAITILTFIFIFFNTKYYFPIAAILIMMYADAMASVIGRQYGKHVINVPFINNKRTVEGSTAFFRNLAYFLLLYVFNSWPIISWVLYPPFIFRHY